MKKIRSAFIILAVIISMLFCAAAPVEDAAGEPVFIDVCEFMDVKLYQEMDNMVHMINGSDYYILDTAGQIINRTKVAEDINCFRLAENRLFMIYDMGESTGIKVMNTDDLSLINDFSITVPFFDLHFITCDANENVYYCTYSSPADICMASAGEPLQIHSLQSDIVSMDVYGSRLYLYSDGSILEYDLSDAGFSGGASTVETLNIPARFLNSDVYISTEGYFCLTSGDILMQSGLNPAVYTEPYPSPVLHACDGTVLAVSHNGYSILYADMGGNVMCEYGFDSKVLDVSARSVLTFSDGGLYYHRFEDIHPNDSFPENWDVQGEFLLVDAGTAVAHLTENTPYTVYRQGSEVTSGLCRTCDIVSFKEKCLTIVVRCDINNNG